MYREAKSKTAAKAEAKTETKAKASAKTSAKAGDGAAAKAEPKTIANKSSDKAGIAAYWTPERMRGATLHPALRTKRGGGAKKKAKAKAKAPKGTAVVPAPKLAKPHLAERRFARAAEMAAYETSLVPDVTAFPASTIGKIYLTVNGNDYFATGYVIGERTVFTVASVLYDRGAGQWASNVVFYPEYNQGPGAGLGPFWIAELWVAANWVEKGEPLNDFGALVTTVPIQPFTGSVGLMANAPINQGQYLVLGYPGTPVPGYPFDGERMWQSTSAYMGDVAWIVQASGNMTYGAHGGPWLIFREGGWYANGVFAVQVVDPDSMLSPYFGNELWDFYTFLKNKGYT